jgi:hypothetical protein
MTFTTIAALAILILTYDGLAIDRIPGLRLYRADRVGALSSRHLGKLTSREIIMGGSDEQRDADGAHLSQRG